jgi:hypothetical protein
VWEGLSESSDQVVRVSDEGRQDVCNDLSQPVVHPLGEDLGNAVHTADDWAHREFVLMLRNASFPELFVSEGSLEANLLSFTRELLMVNLHTQRNHFR